VLDEVFAFLKREQLAEIGQRGMGEQLYQYSLTQRVRRPMKP
jgi:hypothetical protein